MPYASSPFPARPGNLTITSSDAVPSLAPPGPYQMRMSATDGERNIMCMDIWFRIVTSSPAPAAGAAGEAGGASGGLLAGLLGRRAWQGEARLWPRFLRWPVAPEFVVEA